MQTVRKRENGASFCHLWMGNLVVYIHLWQPVCTRQQQAAATSVARSVAQSVSSTFWLIHCWRIDVVSHASSVVPRKGSNRICLAVDKNEMGAGRRQGASKS